MYCRELEELEDVPTVSVMDGSLEPSSSGRDTPNDPAFVNFFSVSLSSISYTLSPSYSIIMIRRRAFNYHELSIT